MRKDTGISLRQNVPFKQVPRVLHTVALGVAIYLRSRGGLLHPFGKTFGQLHNDSKGSALPPEGGGGTGESAASLSISSFPSQIQHGGNGGFPGILPSLPPPLAPGRQLIIAQEDERCPRKLKSSGQSCTPGVRECWGRDPRSCRCTIWRRFRLYTRSPVNTGHLAPEG